jgi:transcriptional regulator with XRE-family HTH domain
MGEIKTAVLAELGNKDYRHGYAGEFADMILARQIRVLRKERGLTQAELASMIGSGQSFISEIEDEDYGSLSLKTLKDLAKAFDVYLDVRFASFARLLAHVEHTAADHLKVPPFDKDPLFAGTFDTLTPADANDEVMLPSALAA